MDTLGKRIKRIITHQGTTMTQFAKELNISQSMVSKICADKAIPSDRTISDICRIFNINREWLLHDVGEMVDTRSLEAELIDGLKDSIKDQELLRNFAATLASLSPALWPILADYITKFVNEYNHQPESIDPFKAGYLAGLKAGQEVRKLQDSFESEPNE